MDETWKRLNTYVSPETKRLLKMAAADMCLPLPEAVDYLLQVAFNKLPASGSRPEPMARQQSGSHVSQHSPEGPDGTAGVLKSDREENPHLELLREQARKAELINPYDPDEIVSCEVCGCQLPRSSQPLHEENCRAAQQGYWDSRSFRA